MCAVPNMDVFLSSLISCFPRMLLRYFLNYFETVPIARIIIGVTLILIFHMSCVCVVRSLYFRIFSAFSVPYTFNIYYHTCFFFSYHGLWCLVYCWGWFCRFSLLDSTACLPLLLELCILTLVHSHTSVLCLILPIFPCVFWSVFERTLYHVFLRIVLLPKLI